jgi:hypothetical protein
VLGQLGDGQAIGAEQPAVVGDDLHGAPAGIEQLLDAMGQPFDFGVDLARQVVLELMTAVIQVAGLQPAASLRTGWEVQLVIAQHRVALGGEGLAQFGSAGGFAGVEGWSKVFR